MSNFSALGVFGGAESIANSIIDRLKEDDEISAQLIGDIGPVEFLKSVSRQQLLDFFSRHGLTIDEVMPIKWDDETKQFWFGRMNQNSSGGISSSGTLAPKELLLETFVRLEALNELCLPATRANSEHRAKIRGLRDKYRNALK